MRTGIAGAFWGATGTYVSANSRANLATVFDVRFGRSISDNTSDTDGRDGGEVFDLFTTRLPNVEKKTGSTKRHIAKLSRFVVGEGTCKLRKSRGS